MKITHIALCGKYTDGFSYQENLLAKYHRKMGLEVSMVTSKYIFDQNGNTDIDTRSEYVNKDGIKIIRLNNRFGTDDNSKIKIYDGLYNVIESERPDILFIHGVQFLGIFTIVKYLKKNNSVKVYVDNHADFSNSAKNWLSKNILHKFIWKACAQKIEPYTEKFYGVLPARVNFLTDMYQISAEKIELLVMGADDEKVRYASQNSVIKDTRKRYEIEKTDFLIVTGGKIDKEKQQVLNLMKVINKLDHSNTKLLVYGSVADELKAKFNDLLINDSIEYIGWIDDNLSYEIFSAADLVVFPGRHSVYWEQVVAMGKPLIVKYWEGTTHINFGDNSIFLYDDTVDELYNVISQFVTNGDIYKMYANNALKEERHNFLYSKIAEKSIDC